MVTDLLNSRSRSRGLRTAAPIYAPTNYAPPCIMLDGPAERLARSLMQRALPFRRRNLARNETHAPNEQQTIERVRIAMPPRDECRQHLCGSSAGPGRHGAAATTWLLLRTCPSHARPASKALLPLLRLLAHVPTLVECKRRPAVTATLKLQNCTTPPSTCSCRASQRRPSPIKWGRPAPVSGAR